jgi:hypothetical protein
MAMSETDKNVRPEWDDMIETVMDLIPAKLSHSEWRSTRENINTAIRNYVAEIFERSEMEFRTTREGESQVRLWMSIGEDCVDFQKGIDTKKVAEGSYAIEGLIHTRDVLTARIEHLQREESD